ncbi:desulfoferrodoxin [bacterium]|nr:desulfoferrodoxin [bacterium]
MAKRFEVYRCSTCGNTVEVLLGGAGQLVCCGRPMTLLAPNTVDAALEKHVPVIEAEGDNILVKVGSVPHPMTEEHYIQWIELVDEECGRIRIKFLKPGEAPQAEFSSCADCKEHIYARAYCNIHGFWKSN